MRYRVEFLGDDGETENVKFRHYREAVHFCADNGLPIQAIKEIRQ